MGVMSRLSGKCSNRAGGKITLLSFVGIHLLENLVFMATLGDLFATRAYPFFEVNLKSERSNSARAVVFHF